MRKSEHPNLNKINWDKFQNKSGAFKHLRPILQLLGKYSGISIAEMISRYKKDQLTRDSMSLAAMNVFLAIQAGKAEGLYTRAHGMRKSGYAESFVRIKEEAQADGAKITDNLVREQAEVAIKRLRIKEAKAQEKHLVLTNVMYRVGKVLDMIENAGRSLTKEDRYTN